jgi:hypothetical protein
MLRDVEQDNWKMLQFDPQENVFMPFFNNLNTRIIEKDRFVSQTTVPGISDDTYFAIHPSNRNPAVEGMVGGRRDNERGLGGGGGGGSSDGIQDVGDIRQFSGTNALFS